mmetsp:Transcript_86043/g.263306  ORF Transcript_86043/g.263306 Transcript_86043/m.263306 type:complete len:202 (-) Transcript_86043:800-1405(-)
MLPYTATEENIQKNLKLGLGNLSRAPWRNSAGRCFESKTVSHFSQLKPCNMPSCSTPAEWMMPMRFGEWALMNSSVASCVLRSSLLCSTMMPIFSALASMRFHAGMLASEIFTERDRNFISKPFAPCSSALARSHSPMTSASAPFPPVIAIVPELGMGNSCWAASYGFDESWRITKRPFRVIRTELWPKQLSRRSSEHTCA